MLKKTQCWLLLCQGSSTEITPGIKQQFTLQFNRYNPDEKGRIAEKDFAAILLLYAGLSEVKRVRMLKRVKRVFNDDPVVSLLSTRFSVSTGRCSLEPGTQLCLTLSGHFLQRIPGFLPSAEVHQWHRHGSDVLPCRGRFDRQRYELQNAYCISHKEDPQTVDLDSQGQLPDGNVRLQWRTWRIFWVRLWSTHLAWCDVQCQSSFLWLNKCVEEQVAFAEKQSCEPLFGRKSTDLSGTFCSFWPQMNRMSIKRIESKRQTTADQIFVFDVTILSECDIWITVPLNSGQYLRSFTKHSVEIPGAVCLAYLSIVSCSKEQFAGWTDSRSLSETLVHVAKTVAHVTLTRHLVDVVFVLFDEDGQLKKRNKQPLSKQHHAHTVHC